ncbi:MAG: enoyl-CoA hydratase-related protein [Candidatus Binatia bacterium]
MSDLLTEKRGHVFVVTFNRPAKKNAVTPEMVVRLADAWKAFREDDELRVAVLTGTGDSFCAGADLGRLIPLLSKARPPEDDWDRAMLADPEIFQTAFLRRFELWKPIVAAVNGFALAGGTEILQATDLRIAAPEAKFALTEPTRGIIPGGGSTVRLARQIPYVEAMRILLTGDFIGAEEARRVGFVNEVVAREKLMDRAFELADRIAENGPLAVRKIKEGVVRSSGVSLDEGYAIEDALTREILRSEDAKEGPRAFMEKRKPKFTGR